MEKITEKISEYKEDAQNPKKNFSILEENFKKIKGFWEANKSDEGLIALTKEAENSLNQIKGFLDARTSERALKIWKLSESSKLIASQLKENASKDLLNALIATFMMDLKCAPEEMKHSAAPGLFSGIVGLGLAIFPVWSFISIIIAAYHLLNRDYRNRIMGVAILCVVAIGLFVNYYVIR